MFYCLYYYATYNESWEKFKIILCCFSEINCSTICSSNFSMKVICQELVGLVCSDKSMPMSL